MLIKGILHLFIWLLFVSRIIPKYLVFRETNQVQLFGNVWEGSAGVLILLCATTLAVIVFAMGINYIYQYYSAGSHQVDD